MPDDWLSRRRARKDQEEAIRYAANGWPVVPLALPLGEFCPCGSGCLDPHPYGEVVRNGFLVEATWRALPRGFVRQPEQSSRRRRVDASSASDPSPSAPDGSGSHGSGRGGEGWTGWDWGVGASRRSVGRYSGRGGWGIGLVTEGFDVVELPPEYGALLNHQLKETCPTAMAPLRRRWWFFVAPGSVPAAQVEAAGGVLHAGADGWVPAPGTRLETTGRIRWLVHPYLTGWRPYQRRDPIDQVFL